VYTDINVTAAVSHCASSHFLISFSWPVYLCSPWVRSGLQSCLKISVWIAEMEHCCCRYHQNIKSRTLMVCSGWSLRSCVLCSSIRCLHRPVSWVWLSTCGMSICSIRTSFSSSSLRSSSSLMPSTLWLHLNMMDSQPGGSHVRCGSCNLLCVLTHDLP